MTREMEQRNEDSDVISDVGRSGWSSQRSTTSSSSTATSAATTRTIASDDDRRTVSIRCVVERMHTTNTAGTVSKLMTVEDDCRVDVPSSLLFAELVLYCLRQLRYSHLDVFGYDAALEVKNWNALKLNDVTSNPLATVADVIEGLESVIKLKIHISRPSQFDAVREIQQKLLSYLLRAKQTQDLLQSTDFPIKQTLLCQYFGDNRANSDLLLLSEDTKVLFDEWYTKNVSDAIWTDSGPNSRSISCREFIVPDDASPHISSRKIRCRDHNIRNFAVSREAKEQHDDGSVSANVHETDDCLYVNKRRRIIDNATAGDHLSTDSWAIADLSESKNSVLLAKNEGSLSSIDVVNNSESPVSVDINRDNDRVTGVSEHDDITVDNNCIQVNSVDNIAAGNRSCSVDWLSDMNHNHPQRYRRSSSSSLSAAAAADDDSTDDTVATDLSLHSRLHRSKQLDGPAIEHEPGDVVTTTTTTSASSADKNAVLHHPLLRLHQQMQLAVIAQTAAVNYMNPFYRTLSSTPIRQDLSDRTPMIGSQSKSSTLMTNLCSSSSSSIRRKRSRVFIDPVSEIPRLEIWFAQDSHPSSAVIEQLTNDLNRSTYRQRFPKLEPKNIQLWFKNHRAKVKRHSLIDII